LIKAHSIEEKSALKNIDLTLVRAGGISSLPEAQQIILKSLAKQGFFSKIYQKKLKYEKLLGIYERREVIEK
jgi:hypothetical protein